MPEILIASLDGGFVVKFIRFQQGASLIEVLVTVLLLGTSLLAIAAMQVRSLKQNHEALVRTQANLLAYDILERVRMVSPMAPGQLVLPAQNDISARAEQLLPNGTGNLNCNANRLCTITITWSEFARTENASDQQPSIFTYSTRL